MASAVAVRNFDPSKFELNRPYEVNPDNRYSDSSEALKTGGMSVDDLMRLINETRYEPPWRREADIDADYYDGNQLTSEVLSQMEERGIPPLIVNMTQPIINAVLGMEAKTRTDWEVRAENQSSEQVAKALNQRLNEAERASYADRSISEAYASQVKAGLGWVEIGREPDPFRYRYRVQPVHRREIWWDWRARQPDLSDARYLIRKRWFDADVLRAYMPQHEELIRSISTKWDGYNLMSLSTHGTLEMAHSYLTERDCTLEEFEWRDSERHRLMCFEVWYRVFKRGFVMRLPTGQVAEIDIKNPRHIQAVAAGAVQPIPAVYSRMRQSIWIGPHRVDDRETPLPHQNFPYVPFWGFKEDLTGVPYGLIRALRSPQDEINARRSKMLSLLSSRVIVADDDAISLKFNSWEDVADEASRSDMLLVLNAARKNGQHGFKLENNIELNAQQFSVLQESKLNMHEASGIFPQALGDAGKKGQGSLSGVAIDSLVEQSTQTLAEINDNYRFARRSVGEQLLSLIRADMINPEQVQVGEGRRAKLIPVNQPRYAEELGTTMVENHVPSAQVKVALAETPSSQSYRESQFVQLAEMTKALPPEIQQFVIDFVIDASNVPNRKAIAERLRRMLGMPEPGDEDGEEDPVVRELKAAHAKEIAEMQAAAGQMLAENQELKSQLADKTGDLAIKKAALDVDETTKLAKIGTDKQVKDRELDLKERELDIRELEVAVDDENAEADRQHESDEADRDREVQREANAAKAAGDGKKKPAAKRSVTSAKKPSPKPSSKPSDEERPARNAVATTVMAKAVSQAIGPAMTQMAEAMNALVQLQHATQQGKKGKKTYRSFRGEDGQLRVEVERE